jgi:hypothetical protein
MQQGARRRDILQHIQGHMIAPQIKMAYTIRSLLSVAETLRGGLQHRDPETDEVLIDIKNTELYLKVNIPTMLNFSIVDSCFFLTIASGRFSDHECLQAQG